ncbi:hypothetical protein L3Y34_003624 [Caenorhabditis briggsae]|uniref:SAM domain-containing protein n=1 Tax=Caenorhabditis briggsae TaxID=6238 RepID=A0AAE9A9R4_CAEBR|nr:hypothetical protein L3Y34_003624 [Caenorhabditis briggsae]
MDFCGRPIEPSTSRSPTPDYRFRVYLPPGKSYDMTQWTKNDVFRWMTIFMPVTQHTETYIALKELYLDGDVLCAIINDSVSHMTLGISEGDLELIVGHGKLVLKGPPPEVRLPPPPSLKDVLEISSPKNLSIQKMNNASSSTMSPPPLRATPTVFPPPGRTFNMREWDQLDVELWMTTFISVNNCPDFFIWLEKNKIDGEALLAMQYVPKRVKRDSGISQSLLRKILDRVEIVILEYRKIKIEETTQ